MRIAIRPVVMATALLLAFPVSHAFATPHESPALMQLAGKPTSVRVLILAGTTGAANGFAVEWMPRADYDARGGFPAGGDPAVQTGDFFGVPVWVVQGSSGDFTLPPGKWQAIEIGEFFDESGVIASDTNELLPSTEYVVRVTAKESGAYSASAPSEPLFVSTGSVQANCTYTQGYWKTHEGTWPAASLQLGTVSYDAAQLLAIFLEPARGNGLLILAHQLIAAKLNIAGGADATSIASTLGAADALIGNLVAPPVGSGSLSPASVNALATALAQYNNGLLGPAHCGTTPAKAATWGTIKSTYRR
jgi:hypothetical protein